MTTAPRTSTAPRGDVRARTIVRHRLPEDALAVVVVWLLFALVVAAIVGAIATFGGPLQVSGWEQASQIPRWFAGGAGVYLAAVYLPLYVVHGMTRREVATTLPLLVGAVSAVMAALMSLGFAIELVAYDLAGWSQALQETHLFHAPDQHALVLLEFWLVFVVWTTLGALLGAAFYRRPGAGFALIPPVLVIVGVAETVIGTEHFGPIPAQVAENLDLGAVVGSPTLASLVCAAGTAIAAAAAWLVIRDLPIRAEKP